MFTKLKIDYRKFAIVFYAIWILLHSNIGLEAQSPVFHIDNPQNILFGDSLTNAGTKLIWNPTIGAFRAGTLHGVDAPNWNPDSLGHGSAAFGQNTKATGIRSMAWGDNNVATNVSSTAFGLRNEANGLAATSWGQTNMATGESATTWGESNTASESMSTVWGYQNQVSGRHATSWGRNNNISATDATAWGNTNQVTGIEATAWGTENRVIGESATTWGEKNIARSYLETVLGRYADTLQNTASATWREDDYILTVGTGSGNANRHNAISITKNGKISLAPNDAQQFLIVDSIINGSFREPILYPSVANWGYLGSEQNYFAKIYANVFFASATNNYQTFSDRMLKENIQPIRNSSELLELLRPVTYSRIQKSKKEANDPPILEYGLIAQEVEKVLPTIVTTNPSGMKSIGYQALIPLLIQALQEQNQVIDQLETQQKSLNKRILELENIVKGIIIQEGNM